MLPLLIPLRRLYFAKDARLLQVFGQISWVQKWVLYTRLFLVLRKVHPAWTLCSINFLLQLTGHCDFVLLLVLVANDIQAGFSQKRHTKTFKHLF
jgi:hypothetical protein